MVSSSHLNRRRILRGALGSAAVAVGVPFLDCFLNGKGTALANGAELPAVFASWFFGCGLNPAWEPKSVGGGYVMEGPMRVLQAHAHRMNIISGMVCALDNKGNQPHYTGPLAILTGTAPGARVRVGQFPSVDALIAAEIGKQARFRSLEVACDGRVTSTVSQRGGAVRNSAEIRPAALYTRIFGPEFTDPNAAEFKPDPEILLKRSVLSAVAEERRSFADGLGAADRARLDEYFTSLRELEKQVDLQLERPAPLAACSVPDQPQDAEVGVSIESAMTNHRLFTRLLAHAVACGQTRVVNVSLSDEQSALRRPGSADTHHTLTHEETVDPELGYQKQVTWFQERYMEALSEFITAFANFREGDRSLIDRMGILCATGTSYAKQHSLNNIPLFTVGEANGRIKTGLHISARGDLPTRLGLTMQQVFGLSTNEWGTGDNRTVRPLTEIMA